MTPQAIISGNRDEQRTLIVIFPRGAADGLSLVPPIEDDHYYRARPRLAIKKTEAVRLDDRFGLHPNLAALEPSWKEGELAIVHACGIEDGLVGVAVLLALGIRTCADESEQQNTSTGACTMLQWNVYGKSNVGRVLTHQIPPSIDRKIWEEMLNCPRHRA